MNRGQIFLDIMANIKARLGQIIEQKQADENVRSLSTRLFHAQDEERRQLARELHDTTAQNVAAILMDLGVISRKPMHYRLRPIRPFPNPCPWQGRACRRYGRFRISSIRRCSRSLA